MSAIWNDVCAKCKIGRYARMTYVRPVSDGFARPECYGCPPEEHIHMGCDKCGYTELSTVPPPTDTTQPPPVEPPPETQAAANASAHAAAGRSKTARGGAG